MKKKILLVSALTIIVCLSIIVGSTFALFEVKEEINIAVTAAGFNVTARIKGNEVLNKSYNETNFTNDGTFASGGTAYVSGGNIVLTKMTPGDVIKFDIEVTKDSDIPVAYRVVWNTTAQEGKKNLGDVLEVNVCVVDGGVTTNIPGNNGATKYYKVLATDRITTQFTVTVEFPSNITETYEGAAADLYFTVEAVQANAA